MILIVKIIFVNNIHTFKSDLFVKLFNLIYYNFNFNYIVIYIFVRIYIMLYNKKSIELLIIEYI